MQPNPLPPQGNTASLPLSPNPLWLFGIPYIVAERIEASEGNPEKLQPIHEVLFLCFQFR